MKIRAAFVIALCASPASAQRDFSQVEIVVHETRGGVFMLEGSGGNIGLAVGEDGAFLIDDQFAPLSEKIAAAIATRTDQPVAFVLNTHYHGDHTGGNEPFGKSGAHIVAHDNVRARLLNAENPAAPDALPVITFADAVTFHWNGDEISVFHPGAAHTDGDAIVHFRNANVVHMGDVFFAGWFPYIDVAGGGDLDGYISALEQAATLMNADTIVIPGHGPLSRKTDIEATIAMLTTVRTRITALIDEGLNEDEAVARKPLADLEAQWAWQFINGERLTRAAYQSLTRP